MRKAYYYQDILAIFIKKLKFKIFIFISKGILIIIFCFYYMIIFCIIFNYSKCSLIYNFISSLLEQIIICILTTIIITAMRRLSLIFSNSYMYNISKYLNDKF